MLIPQDRAHKKNQGFESEGSIALEMIDLVDNLIDLSPDEIASGKGMEEVQQNLQNVLNRNSKVTIQGDHRSPKIYLLSASLNRLRNSPPETKNRAGSGNIVTSSNP